MTTNSNNPEFFRIEGTHNSFYIFDSSAAVLLDAAAVAVPRIVDSHSGLGQSDGVMFVDTAGGEPFRMCMFNPDGTRSGMCGNGTRCVVRYLVLRGVVPGGTGTVRLDFDGRMVDCSYTESGSRVTSAIGIPSFDPAVVPVSVSEEVVKLPLTVLDYTFEVTAVSMGNPHCVTFVNDLSIDLEKVGPVVEHHELFPARTNFELSKIISPNEVQVRVWERGAGITQACGSAACAVVVAGLRLGLLERKTYVDMPGGRLEVNIRESDSMVCLSGSARDVARGTLSAGFLEYLTAA